MARLHVVLTMALLLALASSCVVKDGPEVDQKAEKVFPTKPQDDFAMHFEGKLHKLFAHLSEGEPSRDDGGPPIPELFNPIKDGQVPGWTEFDPVRQTILPYTQITIIRGGSEEKIKGFVHDKIAVVRGKDANPILRKVRQKLQFYKLQYERWPDSLDDLSDLPSLYDGKEYEYSRMTGNVRIIKTRPEPKILVVRNGQTTEYTRGYLNKQGRENNMDNYVKKSNSNPFEIQRKTYSYVVKIKLERRGTGNKGYRVHSTIEANVGEIVSELETDVTIRTPQESERRYSGNYVLYRPQDFLKLNTQEILDKVKNGNPVSIVKVMKHSIKLRNARGEMVTRQTFNDSAYRLPAIPQEPSREGEVSAYGGKVNFQRFNNLESRKIKYNYMVEEAKKAKERIELGGNLQRVKDKLAGETRREKAEVAERAKKFKKKSKKKKKDEAPAF